MGLHNINSDEFDTIMELIIAILFMGFGLFAVMLMLRNMTARVEIYDKPDKIEVNVNNVDAQDPYWFTPYQAYMFAWHMDEFSYESLSYVCGRHPTDYVVNPGQITSKQRLDVETKNDYTVTLSTIDENGELIRQFLTWRNRTITGQGTSAETRSVKKSINSVLGSNPTKADTYKYYKGNYNNIKYHLELTGEFSNLNDLSDNPNTGGKEYKWVLTPRYH